jgi:peroxiredoxin
MRLSRQQLTLIGIFALFMGPVLLVILMRSSWWQYQPGGLKNHGYLVQPPVKLQLDQTPGSDRKWLVLYVMEQPCEQECIDEVTALRQVHRATGRRGEHLAIGLLSKTTIDTRLKTKLVAIYPEFNLLTDSAGGAVASLEAINESMQAGQPGLNNAHTYILDPMLNVILAYTADASPNDLHKDLKRLLKWSDQETRK